MKTGTCAGYWPISAGDADRPMPAPHPGDAALDKQLVRDLTKRLDHRRRAVAAKRAPSGELAVLRERDRALEADQRERDDDAQELATVEAHLTALCAQAPDTPAAWQKLRWRGYPALRRRPRRSGSPAQGHD